MRVTDVLWLFGGAAAGSFIGSSLAVLFWSGPTTRQLTRLKVEIEQLAALSLALTASAYGWTEQ